MFGQNSILNRLATLVTVSDVASPLFGIFDESYLAWDAYSVWEQERQDKGDRFLDYVALVSRAEQPIGWIAFDDVVNEQDAKVVECMTPLRWDCVLTADTPLVEAAKLFSATSGYTFLILKQNRIEASMSYQDLLSTPFQACLFASLLALEETMLQVLWSNVSLALVRLKPGDIASLKKRYQRSGGQGDPLTRPEKLIALTYFSQKLNILKECKLTLQRLPLLSTTYERKGSKISLTSGKRDKQIKKRVTQLMEIRNALAHPTESWKLSQLLPKHDLHLFLEWLSALQVQLDVCLGHSPALQD